jgi:hypothetical protein
MFVQVGDFSFSCSKMTGTFSRTRLLLSPNSMAP